MFFVDNVKNISPPICMCMNGDGILLPCSGGHII